MYWLGLLLDVEYTEFGFGVDTGFVVVAVEVCNTSANCCISFNVCNSAFSNGSCSLSNSEKLMLTGKGFGFSIEQLAEGKAGIAVKGNN